MAGNEVETAIGIPEEEPVVMAEMGSGFASAGPLTASEPTLSATLIRVRTSARAAGEIKSRGTVIADGRISEAGIVSTSLGQAETMTGYREDRNTKEGMHDDSQSLACSSSRRSRGVELLLRARFTCPAWYMETLHDN